MKKFFVFLLSAFLVFHAVPARADNTPLEACFRSYARPADEMYLLSISALNQNRFDILEMQSQSGYILFRAYAKDYLLTVSNKDNGSSVKIIPANSNFSGGTGVQSALFAELDTAIKTGFRRIL